MEMYTNNLIELLMIIILISYNTANGGTRYMHLKLHSFNEVIISQRKRALRYIHPRTLYVGFTVRVGVTLRC